MRLQFDSSGHRSQPANDVITLGSEDVSDDDMILATGADSAGVIGSSARRFDNQRVTGCASAAAEPNVEQLASSKPEPMWSGTGRSAFVSALSPDTCGVGLS